VGKEGIGREVCLLEVMRVSFVVDGRHAQRYVLICRLLRVFNSVGTNSELIHGFEVLDELYKSVCVVVDRIW
jgi:hypothetical protein